MVAAAAAAAPAAGMQQGADQAPARCGSSASATPQATQPTDTQHKAASARAAASSRCVKLAAGSKSVMAGGGGLTAAAAAASAAFVAAKLGLGDQLESALVKTPGLACLRDAEGRCCLHYAAGYGHEECVDMLLDKGGSEVVRARDSRGDLALHMAAQQGHPMCTYNLAKACTASCMAKNKAGHSPIDVAAAAGRGEVLNAMLLACSGDGNSAVAVAAMRLLLAAGAVPDTWAPNGSSALMLAAAANGVAALQVLLEGGATVELQDALGRSALMFAAGSDATAACNVLLEAHASLSARDRRGRAALDYAPAGSESAKLLQKRLDELESVASQLQQQLLQEGCDAAAATAAAAAPGSRPKPIKAPAAPAAAAAASTTAEGGAEAGGNSSSKKKKDKKKDKKKKKAAKGPAGSTLGATAAAATTEVVDAQPVGVANSSSAAAAAAKPVAAAAAATALASTGFGARSFADAVGPAAAAAAAVPDKLADTAVATQAEPSAAAGEQQGEGFAAAAGAQAEEEEWQVVAPKSKHRAATPAGQPCSSAGPGNAHRSFRSHGAAGSSNSGGLHQQVLLSAAGMAAAAAGSKQPAAAISAAAAPAAARHRRQGSAHSICSTMSFASCDSSSCSAGSSVGCIAAPLGAAGPNTHRHTAGPGSPRRAWGTQPQPPQQRPDAAAGGSSSSKDAAATDRAPTPQQPAELGAEHMPSVPAGGAAAAAAAGSNSRGFKAVLLKSGTCGAGTPTAAAALAAPGSAFAAALQAAKQKGGISSNNEGTATAACTQDGTQAPDPAPAPSGCSTRPDVAAAAPFAGASSTSAQPSQQQEPEAAHAPDSDEHQQQLQRLAGELLQARADLAAAQLQLRQQVSAHQQQLAAVLEDAAAHEATAVQAAVEAAVVETLQSPLLLQVLSTGVQQAVMKERTSMQVKLLQFGLPPAAVLHILTQQQQQPPPPATPRGAEAHPVGANCAIEESSTGEAEGCEELSASGPADAASAHAAAAAAAAPTPNCAPLMAQMLSALANNVLAALGPTGEGAAAAAAAAAAQQQQQHTQQMMFLQRLRQQQQQQSAAAVPELHLDIRSEFSGGSSAFVAPARQQVERGSSAPRSGARESAAEAILKLHADCSSCDSAGDSNDLSAHGGAADDLSAPLPGGQRRSSSGCSTVSALDDVPVTDVAAAAAGSFGTIGCGNNSGGCGGGAVSSSSPHSSSSSAFGPVRPGGSPAGGSLWGDASLVGSPALGTSPFLGPSALLPHHCSNTANTFSSSCPSIPRTSPLGFARGCSGGAAVAAARTQWGFQQPQQKAGFVGSGAAACKLGRIAAAGVPGRSSMDSSRLVDLLPDEL